MIYFHNSKYIKKIINVNKKLDSILFEKKKMVTNIKPTCLFSKKKKKSFNNWIRSRTVLVCCVCRGSSAFTFFFSVSPENVLCHQTLLLLYKICVDGYKRRNERVWAMVRMTELLTFCSHRSGLDLLLGSCIRWQCLHFVHVCSLIQYTMLDQSKHKQCIT